MLSAVKKVQTEASQERQEIFRWGKFRKGVLEEVAFWGGPCRVERSLESKEITSQRQKNRRHFHEIGSDTTIRNNIKFNIYWVRYYVKCFPCIYSFNTITLWNKYYFLNWPFYCGKNTYKIYQLNHF